MKNLKIVLGIAGFAALMIVAVFLYNTLNDDIGLTPGQETTSSENTGRKKAPDFTMTDWDGNILNLSELISNGKPVVLNFWASWCPPCKKEMPDFERVYMELGDKVQFVMLNLADGARETRESGTEFINEHGYTFPVFFDVNRSGASAYTVRSIPTTLFIDKDGYITNTKTGVIDEKVLRNEIGIIFKN